GAKEDGTVRPAPPPRKPPPPPHPLPAAAGGPPDRGDARFAQLEPRRPQRPAGNAPAIAARPRGRDIEFAQGIIGRAKRAARAIEDRDASILVGIEFKKRGCQRIRALGVHGVAGFGPVVNHEPYRSIFLNLDGHIGYPPHDDHWIAAPRHAWRL